ncbi:DUF5123 domain-containing protein [Spirochaetota bacterium]
MKNIVCSIILLFISVVYAAVTYVPQKPGYISGEQKEADDLFAAIAEAGFNEEIIFTKTVTNTTSERVIFDNDYMHVKSILGARPVIISSWVSGSEAPFLINYMNNVTIEGIDLKIPGSGERIISIEESENITLRNIRLIGDTSSDSVRITRSSNVLLECIFTSNSIAIANNTKNVTLDHCLIHDDDDVIDNWTGDMSNITVQNCTFHNNNHAIYVWLNVNEEFYFTSIWNSIFSFNATRLISYFLSAGSVFDVGTNDYNLYFNNGIVDDPAHTNGANGIHNQDPLYADAAAGDFRLIPTSPALNTGDPSVDNYDGSTPANIGVFQIGRSFEPAFPAVPKVGQPFTLSIDVKDLSSNPNDIKVLYFPTHRYFSNIPYAHTNSVAAPTIELSNVQFLGAGYTKFIVQDAPYDIIASKYYTNIFLPVNFIISNKLIRHYNKQLALPVLFDLPMQNGALILSNISSAKLIESSIDKAVSNVGNCQYVPFDFTPSDTGDYDIYLFGADNPEPLSFGTNYLRIIPMPENIEAGAVTIPRFVIVKRDPIKLIITIHPIIGKANVRLDIYSRSGRLVRKLFNDEVTSYKTVNFDYRMDDRRYMHSGLNFVVLVLNYGDITFKQVRTFILVK